MKNNIPKWFILAMLPLLAACTDSRVRMHTIIHADGTCTREVSYSNVMTAEQRDSLWGEDSIGWSQPMPECLNIDAYDHTQTDITEGDTVTTTFKGYFKNVEEMCLETPLMINGHRLQSHATLEKHFRWFYTDYTYTETLLCVADTFLIDVTDYAAADTVSFWFTGQPDLLQGLSGAEALEQLNKIESKIDRWLNDNLVQTAFNYIVEHYDSVVNPPVSRTTFVALQDSIVRSIASRHDDLLTLEPTTLLHDFFHSDAYDFFFDEKTSCGAELSQRLNAQFQIFWFNVPYSLTMPGTVIDAGHGTVVGNTIVYPLTGERLIPHDYVISATSRVTHILAYVVAVLVILIAIGSILYRRKR